MQEKILKEINDGLIKENNILLICCLVLVFVFCVFLCFSIKEKANLKKEKAVMEQQIIDYKWQLEQIDYIIGCVRGE